MLAINPQFSFLTLYCSTSFSLTIVFSSGAVLPGESLFSLTHTGLNSSFVPYFFTSITDLFAGFPDAIQIASETCNGLSDRACLYDYRQTLDSSLAVAGTKFVKVAEETHVELG